MGARRRKQRTHVSTTAEQGSETKKTVPKSFVVRSGAEMSRRGDRLVHDLRRVMEPNTATRLKERRSNKIRDFLSMAGPLGVSHICLVSETESTMNLRLGKFPRGPTLYFRILEYCLAGDVRASCKRPKSPGLEFGTAPLLVLNNFEVEGRAEHKLMVTMLQNYYPTLNASQVRLTDLRRIALYQYDTDTDTILFRHYLIRAKERGLSRLSKALATGQLPSNLGACADMQEFVAKAAGAASDSEPDEEADVMLGQDYLGAANPKASKRAIVLSEIGPRLTLRLVKAVDGLNEGKVLFHAPQEGGVAGEGGESGKSGESGESGESGKEKEKARASTRQGKPVNG